MDHRKLSLKLSHYGIKGKCLGWFKAFFSGWMQEVILNRKSSEKSNVTSGVPQGAVLGLVHQNLPNGIELWKVLRQSVQS